MRFGLAIWEIEVPNFFDQVDMAEYLVSLADFRYRLQQEARLVWCDIWA